MKNELNEFLAEVRAICPDIKESTLSSISRDVLEKGYRVRMSHHNVMYGDGLRKITFYYPKGMVDGDGNESFHIWHTYSPISIRMAIRPLTDCYGVAVPNILKGRVFYPKYYPPTWFNKLLRRC